MAMTASVQSMVASTYVRDIAASRAFYELLGFTENSSGKAATSAWSSLHHGAHWVLLASTSPPLAIPRLPLLFYFFVDDVDAVVKDLGAAGVRAEHMGYPPHALGGELKVLDPDGNTVLLGQTQPSESQVRVDDDASPRFSLLKEAAALVAARGGASTACQVPRQDGAPCGQPAEVKLADAAGHAVWACLDHAHEILLSVSGAFIATQDDGGIAHFLARRRG